MPAERDFHLTLDRAAGLTLEATCAARSAGHGPLPQQHRRLLTGAIRALERAQDLLFEAKENPWRSTSAPKPRQLQLLP